MILVKNIRLLKPDTKKIKYSYAQIIFFGPLYSLNRLTKNSCKMRLHLSGDIFLKFPKNIIVRVFKKRIVFFGEKSKVQHLIRGFIQLKKNDFYTGTGLRLRTDGYIKKPGKIRRR